MTAPKKAAAAAESELAELEVKAAEAVKAVEAELGARIEELERRLVLEDPDGRLIAALAAAQGRFPAIPKTKTANVRTKTGDTYSYSYADLADVLSIVRPILAAEGLAVLQRTEYVEPAGELMLFTELRHVSGGQTHSEVKLSKSPAEPQAFGAALTYLRRYELVTLLGIQADEDTDAQHVPASSPPAPAARPLPPWAAEASKARKRDLLAYVAGVLGDEDRAKTFLLAASESWGHVPDVVVGFVKGLEANRQAAADAARRAQDAGAERPDAPAPEPSTDDPYAERILDAAAAAAEVPEAEPPAEEVNGELERPPAGSIEVDGFPDAATLRELGCSCPTPGEEPRDDLCPIAGHGIPF